MKYIYSVLGLSFTFFTHGDISIDLKDSLGLYIKIYSDNAKQNFNVDRVTKSNQSSIDVSYDFQRNNSEIDITINTTDALAALYYQTHNNINMVKLHLDFMIKLLKDYFPTEQEKIVLDIGCGPGRDVQYFIQNDIKAIGIDLSKPTLQIAQENIPSAQFFLMDMTQTTFPNESFHGLWSCGSFYHLPKKLADQALQEFNRILKINGVFFLAIKEGEGEKLILKEEYSHLPKFYSFYSVVEIESLLKKHNFYVQKIILEKKRDTWINVFAIKC